MDALARQLKDESVISGEQAVDLLKTVTIPSCPSILTALLQETRGDDIDYAKIVRLISSDVGLAASMLKVANSPYFALRTKVGNVQQAVAVLGLKNIVSIVTNVALKASLSPPGVNMERFWERSGYNAAACAHIARKTRAVDRDLAYNFGLFHDCGIPILMIRFLDYKQTLAAANESGKNSLAVEFAQHATNHAVVGAMLAKNWQLPVSIVEAIRRHHDLELLSQDSEESREVLSLVAISLVAEHAVARFLRFRDDREWSVYGADAAAFLGFCNDELEELVSDIAEILSELRSAAA